ncbi:MAG: D-alanyl-D-alanine carboxypeptidase, partial [Clostridia bacterium]|nr:D-alanyl-D-alanine carboxypeptidase [Clostridia bacterium]
MRRVAMIVILSIAMLGMFFQELDVFAEPSVSAHSAILIEKNSGRVLYAKNPDERLPMASTTKIMTSICAIESGNVSLDQTLEISASAAGVEGSSMYLESGEKMTLRELLYGLMLSSGNDAAVAIAECISGDKEKFAELMNKKAEEIGAANTHFTNPNGLPDENHYSTAHDMAKLTAYAMQNQSFAEIVSTKSFKIAGEGKAYPRVLSNHNKLLSMYEGCIGVKTG